MIKLFYLVFAFIVLGFLAVFFFSLANAGNVESRIESSVDKKQAVCNATPNDKGKFDEDGCKKAFMKIPVGTICMLEETAEVKACIVNADICVSSTGAQGKWCTCTFTCKEKDLKDLF